MAKVRVGLVLVVLGLLAAVVMVFGPLSREGALPIVEATKVDASRVAPRKEEAASSARQVAAVEADKGVASQGAADNRAGDPAFDVVRVERDGEAVVAGRAEAGAVVELLRNGTAHDRTVADAAGQFVMTPPKLPAGDHELTLRFKTADGRSGASKQSVTVSVSAEGKQEPVVALATPERATIVLSKPEGDRRADDRAVPRGAASDAADGRARAARAAADEPATRRDGVRSATTKGVSAPVSIETVEAGEGGKLYVTGRSGTGATVRLYLNNAFLASGAAGADGRFAFVIAGGVAPGDYRVRLDEVDPATGHVRSRAEVPFGYPSQVAEGARTKTQPQERTEEQAAVAERRTAELSVGTDNRAAAARSLATGAKAASGEKVAADRPKGDDARPATAAAGEDAGKGAGKEGAGKEGAGSRQEAAASSDAARSAKSEASTPSKGSSTLDGRAVVVVPQVRTSLVARGDNLWRISRRVYGEGVRYTVIYAANHDQIRNPRLIYPGQLFVLPGETSQ